MQFFKYMASSLFYSFAAILVALGIVNLIQWTGSKPPILPGRGGWELLSSLCILGSFLRSLSLLAEDYFSDR